MERIGTLIAYDLNSAIEKFCELSGWEDSEKGVWNCRFNNAVTFEIDYEENQIFQYEQDYVYFYNGDESGETTTEDILNYYSSMVYDPNKYWGHGVGVWYYKGHKILRICMSSIVSYLITQKELPKNKTLLLTNKSV